MLSTTDILNKSQISTKLFMLDVNPRPQQITLEKTNKTEVWFPLRCQRCRRRAALINSNF